jgi:hypothetical protein
MHKADRRISIKNLTRPGHRTIAEKPLPVSSEKYGAKEIKKARG